MRVVKVQVVTLGCKVNQAEGEGLLNGFLAAGFEVGKQGEAADIVVVNTCSVTNEADRKSRKAIYRACEVSSHEVASGTTRPLVVVTGCYAAVAAEEISKIEGVTIVVPQAEKGRLVGEVLKRVESRELGVESKPALPEDDLLTTPNSQLPKKVRAFLKVQDGCDNRCAYCIVPDARGNPISVPVAIVLRGAAALVDGGASEIVVTGINVGKYGKGAGSREQRVEDLIAKILEVDGVKRVRLSSIEPDDVTLDLISMLKCHSEHSEESEASGPKRSIRALALRTPTSADPSPVCRQAGHEVPRDDKNGATPYSLLTAPYLCPHLHIPLQSGDRRVLQRMGRRYTPSDYLRMVRSIRHACPDVAITTDVIVGFPGETDDEFANTMQLLEETKPCRIHVFKYSKRAGTAAADMCGQVSDRVKTLRSEAVRRLGERLATDYRVLFEGKELDVLVEQERNGMLMGTTENYLSVSFAGDKGLVGTIVRHRL